LILEIKIAAFGSSYRVISGVLVDNRQPGFCFYCRVFAMDCVFEVFR